MTRRLVGHAVRLPIVLLSVYTATFLLVVAVPGNPFQRGGRALPPGLEHALRQRYGMEDNFTFYRRYLGRAVRGDFGESLHYENWTCNEIIAASLPVSVGIGITGMALATLGGLTLGMAAAYARGRWIDRASAVVAVLGVSVPSYVAAAILLLLFSVVWPLLPVGDWSHPVDVIRPAIAIGLAPLAYIMRLTRMTVVELLDSPFVRTARAKGLDEAYIAIRHVLPNALGPVLSYLAPATAMAMTGSFVVERVFNIPGLGAHFVNSVLNRDQMLILAIVLLYSSLVVLLNFAADALHAWLDPRVAMEAPA